MSPAERWLRERIGGAPPRLLEAMVAALPADASSPSGDPSVPETLAAAASALYGRVVEGAGGREDALPLLAADALLTHAFQAQAETDAGGLEALALRWSSRERLAEAAR
jgi:hypothetical protein